MGMRPVVTTRPPSTITTTTVGTRAGASAAFRGETKEALTPPYLAAHGRALSGAIAASQPPLTADRVAMRRSFSTGALSPARPALSVAAGVDGVGGVGVGGVGVGGVYGGDDPAGAGKGGDGGDHWGYSSIGGTSAEIRKLAAQIRKMGGLGRYRIDGLRESQVKGCRGWPWWWLQHDPRKEDENPLFTYLGTKK